MRSAQTLSLPYRSVRGLWLRTWVRLRLRLRRLVAVGASTAQVRGALRLVAAVLSGIAWVFLLLRNVLLRGIKRIALFFAGEAEAVAGWIRDHDELRLELYRWRAERRTEKHHTRRGRAAPMILMACAVIAIVAATFFDLGFEVSLDGEKLGYVRDREEIAAVVEKVEQRISNYRGEFYSIDANFSYRMRYMNRSEPVDLDALAGRLFASVGEIRHSYVLKVDGETIGAAESKAALELMLRRILLRAVSNATTVSTGFVNDVRIETVSIPNPKFTPIREMEARLSTERQASRTYVVEAGDTVSAIALRNGTTVDRIKANNPGLDEHKIQVGQELLLEGAEPFLSVYQIITESYQESIPFETEVQYDDTMYKNESRIRVPGVKGLAAVVADVTYVNGAERSREVLSYEVLQEPVNAVKVVGTKAIPRSTPTGKFIKPSAGKFSSGFGSRPNLGDYHTGVDYAGSVGTSIWAADGGTVVWAAQRGNYGKYIIIDHGNGFKTYYCHCSRLLVSVGDKVAQGDVIAKVGMTGRAYGPHLHFEIRYNGKAVNPLKYVGK